MRLLKIHTHPDLKSIEGQTVFTRLATRAIALNNKDILVLHTKRYDDYSLPGGGLDEHEDKITGMKRELIEETGAQNIRDIKSFGIYEEFRPWHKDDFDVQHMISYCYTCSVDQALGTTKHEDYEKKNGMKPLWMNLEEIIKHNESIIKSSPQKGLSVERETFLFKLILNELMEK